MCSALWGERVMSFTGVAMHLLSFCIFAVFKKKKQARKGKVSDRAEKEDCIIFLSILSV